MSHSGKKTNQRSKRNSRGFTVLFVFFTLFLITLTVAIYIKMEPAWLLKADETFSTESGIPATENHENNQTPETTAPDPGPPVEIFQIEAGSIDSDLSGIPDLHSKYIYDAVLITDISEIPLNTPGKYPLQFQAVDYVFQAELEVTDTIPPTITGTANFTASVGSTVSYRNNLKTFDNSDLPVELAIDSSEVNIREPGVYPVQITATDSCGNSAWKTIELTVVEKPPSGLDPSELDQMADQILAEITDPSMTMLQQAEAIYWWTKRHISYVNNSDKSSWIDAAHQGITKASGDCFNYFATAKILLNRAGIENIDVVKSTGSHYWSMVNVGSGWYHFDATPRKSGGEFFMLTDSELKEYSNQHKNTHVWDSELYPATPEE